MDDGCCGVSFDRLGKRGIITCRELALGMLEGESLIRHVCMQMPMDVHERTYRPRSGYIGAGIDDREVNEHSVCGAFAHDVRDLLARTLPGSGMTITNDNLAKLPARHAVYWINCPLDAEFRRWRVVYVGKAADLRSRWSDHHKKKKATEYRCRLDWWEVEPGTEMLIEAALIYEWKPAWNERQ